MGGSGPRTLVLIRRLALAVVLLAAPLLAGSGAPRRVLFLGNSLTYTNDLPRVVATLAEQGGTAIEVAMVAGPNYGLIDHLAPGSEARAALQGGRWDVVVLQQGPSTLPANRDSLVLWARMLDTLIVAAGARPALFMVWPMAGQVGGFDAVRASYAEAAAAVGGTLLPGGRAWQLALQADPTLPLYGPDGFHPSALGTYLAALAVFEGLTGVDARRLPPAARLGALTLAADTATIRLLQRAAHSANTGP